MKGQITEAQQQQAEARDVIQKRFPLPEELVSMLLL
jgi:hypothetical protein